MQILKKQNENGNSQTTVGRRSNNQPDIPSFSSLPSLMDQVFNDDPFFNWSANLRRAFMPDNLGITLPAVNIRETANDFVIEVAVPGMNKKDFKIECDNHLLQISYSRTEESNEGSTGSDYVRREYSFESFNRSFQLPESVNTELVQAKYEDGILRVTIGKKEEARKKPAREISVV
jgi:HSP20 family protein